MEKQINKAATVQGILDWAKEKKIEDRAVSKFQSNMEKENWEFILVRTANLCNVQIVYM